MKEKNIPPFQHFKVHVVCDGPFVPMDLKGTNNPCSSGYKIIPPMHTGVEGVRLLDASLHVPMHQGHMGAGGCKALVTTGSREVGMCHCVHLFPEHAGTLLSSGLFFTCEDILFCKRNKDLLLPGTY